MLPQRSQWQRLLLSSKIGNVSEGLLCRVGSTSKISPESYPLVPVSSSVATTESAGEQIFITMTTVARCSNTEEGQVPVFQITLPTWPRLLKRRIALSTG